MDIQPFFSDIAIVLASWTIIVAVVIMLAVSVLLIVMLIELAWEYIQSLVRKVFKS